MKKCILVILGAALSLSAAHAASDLELLLPKILNRVAECSVRPYSVSAQGIKTYHAILSHCKDVQVTSPGNALIRIEGHEVRTVLSESADSDGDFYEVTFQDARSGESLVLNSVPAYGDVLLGILGGRSAHLVDQEVPEGDESITRGDATLLN